MQDILRDPTIFSPAIILRGDVDEIFAAYYDHMILEDVRHVWAPHPCSMVYDYIQ